LLAFADGGSNLYLLTITLKNQIINQGQIQYLFVVVNGVVATSSRCYAMLLLKINCSRRFLRMSGRTSYKLSTRSAPPPPISLAHSVRSTPFDEVMIMLGELHGSQGDQKGIQIEKEA
jgi:hypothetical protein